MTGRILFVGAEQPLWAEFRADLGRPDSAWKSEFAGSGAKALELLARLDFSAVVAEVRLPDTSGLDLLQAVMRRQPNALRIVLSDAADTAGTVSCIGTSHHHLLKPCDTAMLLSVLNRAFALDAWLPGEAVQGLIGRMRWMPSPPALYFQVAGAMQSPTVSVEAIGRLIAEDPAITAKVLQLANSAVFGLQLQVLEPVEAVAYLGLETTKALVLLAHTFLSFERPELAGFSIETLWRHAVLTGRIARRISQAEHCELEPTEQASAAGLLHDLGKLLLAANLAEPFGQALKQAREQQRELWEVETEILGTSHAELGASLLGIWGLPRPIVEAVACHHQPPRTGRKGFTPLTAVHVANVLAHESCREIAVGKAELDESYLRRLGLEPRLEAWRELCLEPETELSA